MQLFVDRSPVVVSDVVDDFFPSPILSCFKIEGDDYLVYLVTADQLRPGEFAFESHDIGLRLVHLS